MLCTVVSDAYPFLCNGFSQKAFYETHISLIITILRLPNLGNNDSDAMHCDDSDVMQTACIFFRK